MEGPEAADSAGDDYMTMDAENWLEHDDTYENGDTNDSGRKDGSGGHKSGPDSRQQKKEPPRRPNPNTARPPFRPPVADRYLTIRRPPLNTHTGSGMKQSPQLVLFRRTTVCMVSLCILLLGGLFGLSFYSVTVREKLNERTETLKTLQKENDGLEKELGFLRQISRPIYQASSTDNSSTGRDLFILNYDILEELKKWDSFHLARSYSSDEGRSIEYSWNCTRNYDWELELYQ